MQLHVGRLRDILIEVFKIIVNMEPISPQSKFEILVISWA